MSQIILIGEKDGEEPRIRKVKPHENARTLAEAALADGRYDRVHLTHVFETRAAKGSMVQ